MDDDDTMGDDELARCLMQLADPCRDGDTDRYCSDRLPCMMRQGLAHRLVDV